jgi:hypothetical protein
MIALAGVMTLLGFAAYLSVKSQPKPAAAFNVAIKPGASNLARPPQASPQPSNRPVVEPARLPEQAPALVPATEARRRGTRSVAQLRSAVAFASSGEPAPPDAAGQGASGPGVAEASNLGPGPNVAATNNPPQPGAANPAPATSPAATPATPASAVLMPHGSILLNGHPATDSTALFPGDRVQVPDGSYASINGNGSLTVLQPGASAVYTGKALDLQQGGVAVSTLEGMPVNTEGLSIMPRASHGKYDVLDDNGSVQVASLEGDLNIMDGGKATLLASGQQTTLDKRKKAAAAPSSADTAPAPETPPASASGGFPTGKVLLIGGAAAGGITAAILLTRSSSKPVSPAVP